MVIVSSIKFFNMGSYTDPVEAVEIRGRSSKDYTTPEMLDFSGPLAEEFAMDLEELIRKYEGYLEQLAESKRRGIY